jgi:hypothetical protein
VPDFATEAAQNLNISRSGGCLFDSPVCSFAMHAVPACSRHIHIQASMLSFAPFSGAHTLYHALQGPLILKPPCSTC